MAYRPRHNTQRKTARRAASSAQRGRDKSFDKSSAADASASPPRISSAMREMLRGIGTPEAQAFVPDAFQIEALARIETEDVLVTAPTGSGKTWIAREEIRRLLEQGKQAWYTSPLKALTNSKYIEFAREFGAEQVGILTGDRKENSGAPLVIGTTEVFRNQLFDSLRRGEELRADLVILDEAHYMGDEERGHVWEETIILLPPRVRLLLLSATIGNADELAHWISEVRNSKCSVVTREFADDEPQLAGEEASNELPGVLYKRNALTTKTNAARPVPLRAAFMFDDGSLAPLQNENGDFNAEISRYLQRLKSTAGAQGRNTGAGWRAANGNRQSSPRHGALPAIEPALMIDSLAAHNLLPAIVFTPTRRRCDESAIEAAQTSRHATKQNERQAARRTARREFLEAFVEQHPELRRHRHLKIVERAGLAAHHAGHLPMWKVAIEEMMSRNLLDAIFATSTVAAGVDFPARTVVLTVADARSNQGWRPLLASEFSQMTGRAGRRGKDKVGFIVAASGAHQNPNKIFQLLHASHEPLESQFRATYTTLLNLLDAYGNFRQVREIVERSFAFRIQAEKIIEIERDIEARQARLAETLRKRNVTRANASTVRAIERLTSARTHLLEAAPQTRIENFLRFLDEQAVPLRVVSLGRNTTKLIFLTERRGARLAGVREDGSRTSLALERIGRVFSKTYKSVDDAESAFAETHERANTPLAEPRFRGVRADTDEATGIINDLLQRIAGQVSDDKSDAEKNDSESIESINSKDDLTESLNRTLEVLYSLIVEAAKLERDERRLDALRGEVWRPFAERAKVLAHFGYLDYERQVVTERGRWLADLRVDRPLLIGEGLAANLFNQLSTSALAGLAAALASDADRSYGELPIDDSLMRALAGFERIADKVAQIEWAHTIEPAPEMNYSAAAAAARWAAGAKWDALVRDTGAEEGDLFRMLSRTGESLLQLARLSDTHREAATRASHAASAILRAPVRD